MKHTKGPWYPVQYANYWNIQKDRFYGDENVLDEEQNPDAKANAILAAASPDLLEAIQYYFKVVRESRGEGWKDKPDHVLSKMIDAVDKATKI